MEQVTQTTTFNNTAPPTPPHSCPNQSISSPAGSYLADDVPHLLGVDDVGRVDDGGEAGSVQLRRVLVLSLLSGYKGRQEEHTNSDLETTLATVERKEGEGDYSDLAEDVRGVPGPHEVGGVRGQRQHALALDLQLQGLLVLPLQT